VKSIITPLLSIINHGIACIMSRCRVTTCAVVYVVSAREHKKTQQACEMYQHGLLQCGGGVWGPGPSVVGVGRFYGRLVLEGMSKIAFGKMVWSSFIWLLAIDSV